jgi:hypothetical protein
MRLSLHSLVLAPVLVAAAAFTTQSASAAVLHVPFAFTVSGQTLPAGDYSVDRQLRGDSVVLTSREQGKSFSWLLTSGDPDPGSKGVIMRFDATSSGYALREIQYNATITHRLDKKLSDRDDRPVHVIRGE